MRWAGQYALPKEETTILLPKSYKRPELSVCRANIDLLDTFGEDMKDRHRAEQFDA